MSPLVGSGGCQLRTKVVLSGVSDSTFLTTVDPRICINHTMHITSLETPTGIHGPDTTLNVSEGRKVVGGEYLVVVRGPRL